MVRTCGVLLLGLLAWGGWSSDATADDPGPRTPAALSRELLAVYGDRLESMSYLPAMAVYARLRFGTMTDDPDAVATVERLLSAERPAPRGDGEFAGHLVFAGWADTATGDAREAAIATVRQAADRLFTDSDPPQVRLPNERVMSDAVYMRAPLMCEAGRLTGQPHYFDGAVAFLKEMVKLRVRDDGIYRHGHLCDAAWGRGNGFPALGMAWCLECLPADHPGRPWVLEQFQKHLTALLPHQDDEGMWHQVIDEPESYAEFSCTAMIGTAMQRGIRRGWLDADTFQEPLERAWRGINARVKPDGHLIDVCEGTGTQRTLDDYLKRRAIRGRDARGGAMALLFATERLSAEQQAAAAP